MKSNRILFALGLVLASGCGSEQPAELDVAIGSDRVPATWRDRQTSCNIPDKPAERTFSEGRLAGQTIRYLSSDDVDYTNPNWPYLVASSWNALNYIDANAVKIAVIDIRNVDGRPHYHYFSNGSWNGRNQNWSSTKFLGQLAAVHKIRLLSNGVMGTDSYINDTGVGIGSRRLTYHSYRLHHDSWNTAGGLFKQVAGLNPVNGGDYSPTSFVRGWLARPGALFNGYYGDSNYDGYYTLRKGSPSSSTTASFAVPSGRSVARTANLLSPLTLAESWKRIGVNFRDEQLMPKGQFGSNWQSYAYDGGVGVNSYIPAAAQSWRTAITESDIADMFYGPIGGAIGGALHDIGIRNRFTAAFGGHLRLDAATDGRWRIFGKTGSGRNDRAYGAYFCLPGFKGGREFAIFLVSKRGTAAASDAIAKVLDTLAPGIRTGSPRPGPDPDLNAGPVCKPRPTSFTNNQSFRLTHGQSSQFQASVAIDSVTARKSSQGIRYAEKFFVKHSATDLSNIAFNYDPAAGTMQGIRYNLSWNADLEIAFKAEWDCDGFYGEFNNGGQTEPLVIR